MTKLLDEPDPAVGKPLLPVDRQAKNSAGFPTSVYRPHTRSQALSVHDPIVEEPLEDDFRYIPMPTGSISSRRSRRSNLRDTSRSSVADSLQPKPDTYGSFRFPSGQVSNDQFSERIELRNTNDPGGFTVKRLAFLGLILLLLLILAVGIIVEITADRVASAAEMNLIDLSETTTPLISPVDETLRDTFPDLRSTLLRTKHFTRPQLQQQAVEDLVARLFSSPETAARFTFSVIPDYFDDPAKDTANITSIADSVKIVGNSGTACSWALYYFLKYYCGCHVSWSGRQLNLPSSFPVVSLVVKKADWFHYYQNVCTSSYSFAWWNWTRWEQEIDWMALNGVNFPLAFTGQEEIWRRVYEYHGLTDEEIQDFFVGPAFLAWGRMGNIRKWGGPLSKTWMSEQLAVQQLILARMQSFGMVPILPAFNGMIPQALQRVYPEINVTRMEDWANFPDDMTGSYFLDPYEPLYIQLGKEFINEMKKEFSYISHFYNADTFNEQRPNLEDEQRGFRSDFIVKVAKATFDSMRRADPEAIWVMQGWIFVYDPDYWTPSQTKELLTSIPQGRMVVLDLFAENAPVYNRTESFYGQPFIWCMLHNFGGVLGLYGRINSINSGPSQAREYLEGQSTMVGVGLAPEGINQNDIIYELMNEMSWRDKPTDLEKWVTDYSNRRYGAVNNYAHRVYVILQKSVFDCSDSKLHNHGGYILTKRPGFNFTDPIWYDPDDVFLAWDMLLKVTRQIPTSDTLNYDIVDFSRQGLQIVFGFTYHELMKAYLRRHYTDVINFGAALGMILDDLESILIKNSQFSLEEWVESAKSWGRNANETALYEYNARNQITLWGPNGEIRDYATKQWSGVVSNYYAPRWKLFAKQLAECVKKSQAFDQKAFDQAVFQQVEEPFTFAQTIAETKANPTDIYRLSWQLFTKYHEYRSLKFLHFLPHQNLVPGPNAKIVTVATPATRSYGKKIHPNKHSHN